MAAAALTLRAYRDDRAEAEGELLRLARQAASDVATQVEGIGAVLESLARQEAVASLDPSRCQPVLQGFSGLGPGHLVLVEAGGRVLCSSLEGVASVDYAGAEWLAQVRRGTGPGHAEPVVDPLTERRSLVVAVPVAPAPGPPPAALAGVIDLSAFAPQLLGSIEQARGAVLLVLDASRRTVLARVPPASIGEPVRNPGFGRESGSFEASGLDGVRRLYHQAAAPELGWHIYAGIPTAVAFAPARQTVRQSVVLAAVVFSVLAVLAGLLHRGILRPVRALTAAIAATSAGPGPAPAPEDGPSELARVALEFNAMLAARARDEEALRQSEARSRAMLESALDAVISMDHEGRILEFSQVAETVFGYDRQAVLGRSVAEILVPPPLREAHRRGLAHYLATGEGPVLGRRIEVPALRADGSELPVELAVARVDLEGPPVFTAYVRDITERRRAEEEVRNLNAALAERVAELGEARAELQRALARFTQSQEEERRLIAHVLHDDTIQALSATLWSLDDLGEDDNPARRRTVLGQARSNLEAAVAAARSMLFELRPPALDELGLVAAVEQQLAKLSEETGAEVELETNLGGRLATHVETLAFRTTQEALRNVRKHAGADSVRVRIQEKGRTLHVTVDDDGVGIQVADLAQRARQGHVGVVSMRENITTGGGRFDLAPRARGGTRLSFTLPIGAGENGAEAPPG